MKLKILHPEKQSLKVVSGAIDDGETIYRSPHVGNVNNQDLGLTMGLSAMGGQLQLELVDTIRGSDNFSQPKVAMVGLQKVVLSSNKHAGRIVGSCEAKVEGIERIRALGIDVDPAAITLKDIHVESLRKALPEGVSVTPSTEFFGQIGADIYEMVMRESEKVVSRNLRTVTATGRIEDATDAIDFSRIYGLDSAEGLLPPLEAMMAIEVIKKVLENGGCDNQIVHIGGDSMVQYTKLEGTMQPVEDIANRVLSDLGVPSGVILEYIVPSREEILASKDFDPVIGNDVNSQYDILVSKQAVREEL